MDLESSLSYKMVWFACRDCVALESGMRGDPEVFNVAGDSGLWEAGETGRKLVRSLSSFIVQNWIKFPMGLGVFPFTKGSRLRS